eukprot:GHVU01013030.1.p1 GENE.GHVU01013030.1~~GHVU01013030.1.p1  ORF type:complete len:123 (-),score=21.90 GHVU01013030.1:919-1287(-)
MGRGKRQRERRREEAEQAQLKAAGGGGKKGGSGKRVLKVIGKRGPAGQGAQRSKVVDASKAGAKGPQARRSGGAFQPAPGRQQQGLNAARPTGGAKRGRGDRPTKPHQQGGGQVERSETAAG